MKYSKKYQKEILFSLIIILAYFTLRTIFLTNLPIFTDEAIYIRWSQTALHDASWRFISLTDGKQPMFVWIMMPFLKIINDPLLAGRLVSVISGFFTMVGLWLVSFELFKNKRIAFFTALLYVFYPFAQVYDRMALYDSMVATFAIWSLYLSLLLIRKTTLGIAYTLGFILGGGLLTKSSNLFSELLLPCTLLVFDIRKHAIRNRFIIWVLYAVFAIVISQGIYAILKLSPLFGVITEKNALFVYPFSEWIQHPFSFFLSNLIRLSQWLCQYFTLSYILLLVISCLKKPFYVREKFLLFLYFFLPFIALALFGKQIYPRFIFFMSLMLLPIAASGLDTITITIASLVSKRSTYFHYGIITFVVIIFIFQSGFASFQFIFDPAHAAIATPDRNQYVNSWTAGWGVKESIAYFQEQAAHQKIFIGSEGTFGLLPETLEMYLINNPNITDKMIKGFWPINQNMPQELTDHANHMPTYVIFYQPCSTCQAIGKAPPTWPLTPVLQIEKNNGKINFVVYQVVKK